MAFSLTSGFYRAQMSESYREDLDSNVLSYQLTLLQDGNYQQQSVFYLSYSMDGTIISEYNPNNLPYTITPQKTGILAFLDLMSQFRLTIAGSTYNSRSKINEYLHSYPFSLNNDTFIGYSPIDNLIDRQNNIYQGFFDIIDFDSYGLLLDDTQCYQLLNGITQVWSTSLSDDDYKKILAIESYNRNALLARINQISVVNDSSSGSSSVDLSTINTQLTNIANNLKTTVHDDNTGEDIEVSVTDIIKDKEDINLIEIQEVETKNKELVPFLNTDESWGF